MSKGRYREARRIKSALAAQAAAEFETLLSDTYGETMRQLEAQTSEWAATDNATAYVSSRALNRRASR